MHSSSLPIMGISTSKKFSPIIHLSLIYINLGVLIRKGDKRNNVNIGRKEHAVVQCSERKNGGSVFSNDQVRHEINNIFL